MFWFIFYISSYFFSTYYLCYYTLLLYNILHIIIFFSVSVSVKSISCTYYINCLRKTVFSFIAKSNGIRVKYTWNHEPILYTHAIFFHSLPLSLSFSPYLFLSLLSLFILWNNQKSHVMFLLSSFLICEIDNTNKKKSPPIFFRYSLLLLLFLFFCYLFACIFWFIVHETPMWDTWNTLYSSTLDSTANIFFCFDRNTNYQKKTTRR